MTDNLLSNKKPARLIGMKPAGDVESYSAVPWFRKQEFALFPLLLPATIFIALTGDVFHKATPKMMEHSDANVWRYTRASRTFFIVVSLVVVVVGLMAIFG